MPPITCHILDSSVGKPASNVLCCLYKVFPEKNDTETLFAMNNTNGDGRISSWIVNPNLGIDWLRANISSSACSFKKMSNTEGKSSKSEWQSGITCGQYKIRFYTKKYFDAKQEKTFYPFVDIYFHIENNTEHYHIPLLLTNYSYTTYRGS